MDNFNVPLGLFKCQVCGFYKGKAKSKDLNWEYSFDRETRTKSEDYIGVSCLCDGPLCPQCKKTRVFRPCSNIYYPEDNHIEHVPVPVCALQLFCDECRKKERTR